MVVRIGIGIAQLGRFGSWAWKRSNLLRHTTQPTFFDQMCVAYPGPHSFRVESISLLFHVRWVSRLTLNKGVGCGPVDATRAFNSRPPRYLDVIIFFSPVDYRSVYSENSIILERGSSACTTRLCVFAEDLCPSVDRSRPCAQCTKVLQTHIQLSR